MRIVFFTHPPFLGSQSMPRFASMLAKGMQQRGHQVEVWTPEAYFYKLSVPNSLKKWLGYLDQYIMFPGEVRKRIKSYPNQTLFVFTDHALGPWVPLVTNRPHVIHCHDFLAQQSAFGKIKENQTGFTGRMYQKFIRKGYLKGKNFISVSSKTKQDLQELLTKKPQLSDVIYNGLNRDFKPLEINKARQIFGKAIDVDLSEGYILHIGGNQWYKNRIGVIEIYESWRKLSSSKLPLLLIGKEPTTALKEKQEQSAFAGEIYFLTEVSDEQTLLAYAGATLLLFPSLAEGFGWPIAEAMASGCPVVTTNQAPMTEVAGNAGFLIKKRDDKNGSVDLWADDSALVVDRVINLSSAEREMVIDSGIKNAKRFQTETMLNSVEEIYKYLTKSFDPRLEK
ncbi:glycosyltransferase [Mucilaginibacter sp. Mucisp86]|uniref:glycosyltransferase n=1 Tax=Mucilaginibacter sp. Mucisp86 TaxID=3243060 RepID=UPI0039B45D1F